MNRPIWQVESGYLHMLKKKTKHVIHWPVFLLEYGKTLFVQAEKEAFGEAAFISSDQLLCQTKLAIYACVQMWERNNHAKSPVLVYHLTDKSNQQK